MMSRKVPISLLLLVLSLALATPAFAASGQPNFGEAIYADGGTWGTKGTTSLPAPNDHNTQSFDLLFRFTNGAPGQLPVAEAAPGNSAYNGGRWAAQSVTWTPAGIAAHAPLPVLTSYEEIMLHFNLGHLAIVDLNSYFQCPLLPSK